MFSRLCFTFCCRILELGARHYTWIDQTLVINSKVTDDNWVVHTDHHQALTLVITTTTDQGATSTTSRTQIIGSEPLQGNVNRWRFGLTCLAKPGAKLE